MADTEEIVVFYHYPCADGIFGALCAALVLGETSAVKFFPLTVFEKEETRTQRVLGETRFTSRYHRFEYAISALSHLFSLLRSGFSELDRLFDRL